ncbi:MAG: DUF11 domain-containing protein [Parcubacteria group bacterium]|nr:DUF11 domain-containing protein [Parcubacteria group bacterium]
MPTRKKRRRTKQKSGITKWIIFFLLVFVVAAVGGIWWVFSNRQPSFTGDNVEFALTGSAEIGVGEMATYTITYTNNEKVTLEDVEVSLIYPEGFSFSVASQSASNFGDNKWEIGTLDVGQSGSLSIKGNLFGSIGSTVTCAAGLTYRPTNVNSTFSNHVQADSKISGLDISLEAKVPDSVQKESEFEFPIIVRNTTQADIANVRVKVTWPNNFELVSAAPTPKVSDTWDLTKLEAGGSKEIKIKGKMTGEVGSTEKIKVQAGLFDEQDSFYLQQEKENDIKMVDISGELKLLVNNKENLNANPGDSLDIILSYKNTGTESLRNARVVLEFNDADLFDSESIEVSRGTYKNEQVTWDAGGVEELADVGPERAGAVALKAKLVSTLSVKELTDKNFSLQITPKLISTRAGEADVEIPGNNVEVKINSEITLGAEARYHDFAGKKIGSGPLPPQVGEKTTYRVYLSLGNRTNEVSSGRVEINLGKIAKWTNVKNVSVGDLKYEGGKVIWDVGRIPANTGQFTENIKADFAVEITPRAADVGKTVELVKDASFSGSDEFTSSKLTKESESLDTELESDFMAQGKGKVVE